MKINYIDEDCYKIPENTALKTRENEEHKRRKYGVKEIKILA